MVSAAFGTTNEHGHALFEYIACGKSQLTMKRWSCDRPATFDVIWRNTMWHDVTWHDVTLRDVTWRDMTWRDVTWRDITWHDMTWRGMTWHEVHDVARREMTWDHMTWRDMTWNDVTWRDLTWQDVTWRNMTWHNVAWHDITWHDNKDDDKALVVWPSRDFRATAYKFRAFLSRNLRVTSKTSWTRKWPEFLRSPKHNSSVGMSSNMIRWPQKHKLWRTFKNLQDTITSTSEYVLNWKFTWIFEITQTWWQLCRNISNGFPDLENTNSVKISKIHKTESSVPLEQQVDLDYRGDSNIVAQ